MEIGVPAIGNRILHLTDYLCEQAQRAGFTIYSSRRPEDKSNIVSLIVPGAEPRPLIRACREQSIVINHRLGRIRVSPHCYNSEEAIDRLGWVLTVAANVEVRPFTGLAVHFVREMGARIMLRGLRTLSDMENEFSMSLTNLALDTQIETIFLMAREEYSHISSTLIRQIATFQGELTKF